MKYKSHIILVLVTIAVTLFTVTQCQPEPVIHKKIDIEAIKDSIKKSMIMPDPEIVYIDTSLDKGTVINHEKEYITKWKDSIIYRDKPSLTTIEAKIYKARVETDSSSADLRITSLGEVLDVQGTINYNRYKETITERKFENGFYGYAEASVKPIFEKMEVGVDYVTRKNIIGANAEYIAPIKQVYFNVKLGFRF